jgi:formamidopyrimidine-DNA glycosylase
VPELPEVETVRLDLDQAIVGRTVTSVVLGRLRSVRRYANPNDFIDELLGARITATGRLGKYLFIHLGAGNEPGANVGDSVLVVHLRMSGQLLLPPGGPDAEVAKHTHVRIGFDDGSELRFVDPRTFGEMYVTTADLPELAHLGPDAFTQLLSGKELRTRMRGRSFALKAALLDQTVTAGIGSIYADEISHRAAIRPTRSVARLTGKDFDRLYLAIKEVLGEAILARGSTLGDGQYVGLDGTAGTYANAHRVHARVKLGCATCGGEISTGIVAQRSAYWCRNCQN